MSRLLKASDIQPPDDPARQMAAEHEEGVRRAIVYLLRRLGYPFAGDAVIQMIRRLDSAGLQRVLADEVMADAFVAGYQPIAETFIDAAHESARTGLAGLITYDPLIAMEPLQALRSELATTLTASARAALQGALLQSIRTGVEPSVIASRLREVIGLNEPQQRAVANYRRLLENGDTTALRRALRNEKYDDLVRQAVRNGSGLSPARIDEMVADYAARQLSHRASTIAATETMQATVSGIRAPYVQAIKTGRLLDSEVKRFWLTAADELVCYICASIPLLNKKGVGVNDEYETPEGPLDAPLAHVRCRCSERYVANLSRLSEQPFQLAA